MSRIASTSASRWLPWAAVAVSLAYRAVYFIQIRGNPFFGAPIMDEGYHDLWARELAHGDWTARIPFFRAPFYPALLGLAYRLFGADPPNFALLRGLQLAFGAVTPLLVYRVARRLVPSRPAVAAVAAFLIALDGMLLYFEADLLVESILAPLGIAVALLLLRAGETGSPGRWLLAGLAIGAFSITRPNLLAFTPIVCVAAAGWVGESFSLRRPRLAAAAAVTAGTCALVLPVAALNGVVGRDPAVLVAWQGGLNFFLGNNTEANGWSATAPSVIGMDWWGGYNDTIRVAEEAAGRKLRPSEVSDYWFHRASEWWRAHPGDGLRLTARKLIFFFSGIEFSNNRDDRMFFETFAPIGRPALLLYYVLMPLALAGAVFLWRTGRPGARVMVLLVASYAATVVAFFVADRYRLPLRPLFSVFAALGAFEIVDRLRRGGRFAWLPAAGVLAFGLVVNAGPWFDTYRPSPAQFYQSIATIHHNAGRMAEALTWQMRAVQADSTYPQVNLNLGSLLLELDRPLEAIPACERERRYNPRDGRNLVSLAQALAKVDRWAAADSAYEASEATGLREAPALYNHGRCLERLGRVADAKARYRRALEVDSTFADAWNNLGVLAAQSDSLDRARECWQKAVTLRPDYAPARDNLRRLEEMSPRGTDANREGGSHRP
ncbi:MAG: tetratricopeptide repeat protein [bacterium]